MLNIIGVLDRNFIKPYCMTFKTILNNTKEKIQFHLITNDLTNSDKDYIKNILNNDIKFTELPDNYREYLLKNFKRIVTHCTNNTLMKVYIPEYCKENNITDKILYVDGDFMFKGDIKELFEVDLLDTMLGAVSFDWYISHHKYPEKLDPPFSTTFFNAGLMLFNLKKFKSIDYFDVFKKFSLEYYEAINGDQICWNGIIKGDITKLDVKWNTPYYYKYHTHVSIRTGEVLTFPSWDDILGVHFFSNRKAWNNMYYLNKIDPVIIEYRELWKKLFNESIKYIKDTPIDIILRNSIPIKNKKLFKV